MALEKSIAYPIRADSESLCVGWCMAKGMTAKEAFAFYGAMVKIGYFEAFMTLKPVKFEFEGAI